MLLHKHFQIKPSILNTRRFSMERGGVDNGRTSKLPADFY